MRRRAERRRRRGRVLPSPLALAAVIEAAARWGPGWADRDSAQALLAARALGLIDPAMRLTTRDRQQALIEINELIEHARVGLDGWPITHK